MRGEQFLRLQRQAVQEKATNPSYPFDPSQPWDWIYQMAARDSDFWKEELEDPALQVVTKTRALGVALDSDAPIAALNQAQPSLHSAEGSGTAGSWELRQGGKNLGNQRRPPPQHLEDRPSPTKKAKIFHNVVGSEDDVYYMTNRAGRVLCPKW